MISKHFKVDRKEYRQNIAFGAVSSAKDLFWELF
jgi:hypothetical protein